MEQENLPELETIPEPQEVLVQREVLASVKELVDGGEVEAISVYIHHRSGGYRILQSESPDRHMDAGILLEMAVERLGFVHKEDVQGMIDEAE